MANNTAAIDKRETEEKKPKLSELTDEEIAQKLAEAIEVNKVQMSDSADLASLDNNDLPPEYNIYTKSEWDKIPVGTAVRDAIDYWFDISCSYIYKGSDQNVWRVDLLPSYIPFEISGKIDQWGMNMETILEKHGPLNFISESSESTKFHLTAKVLEDFGKKRVEDNKSQVRGEISKKVFKI